MQPIFDTATQVSTPMALAGLAVVSLYLVFRKALDSDKLVRMTGKDTAKVILRIVDWVFVVAILATILGFIGFLATLFDATASPVASDQSHLEWQLEEMKQIREALDREAGRWKSQAIFLVLGTAESTQKASEIAVASGDPRILELATELQNRIKKFQLDFPDTDLTASQVKELELARHAADRARTVVASCTVDELKKGYGFEDGLALGWQARRDGDSQACVGAEASEEYANVGRHSLQLTVDLVGGDKAKHKGEVFLRWINGSTMHGEHTPIDLSGRTVSAWILAPRGTYRNAEQDVAFQLFVKNVSHEQYLYGNWTHAGKEGQWLELRLDVGASAPPDGMISTDFDPTKIAEVGVKVALDPASRQKVSGNFYMDDIQW